MRQSDPPLDDLREQQRRTGADFNEKLALRSGGHERLQRGHLQVLLFDAVLIRTKIAKHAFSRAVAVAAITISGGPRFGCSCRKLDPIGYFHQIFVHEREDRVTWR